MKRLALAMATLGALAVCARADDQAAAAPGATQRVIAGRPQYVRSGWFKFHFGEGYRKEWTTPFEARVLDLKTYGGGLTPVRQVGNLQSIGLALKGADGMSYTFRTLDKDPRRTLPEEWRDSFPAALAQDQTIANHPGGPVIVAQLAEAAGVPHTQPQIVYMPNDAALGEFRATFGGKAGTIDEYPQPAAGQRPGFAGAVEIIPTDDVWKRWQDGQAKVDRSALLHDRLFDLFLGDWDRHDRQWRWMRLPGQEALVPLPEDRDQAFANFSGLMMSVVRSVQKKLVAWHDDYSNLDGLLVQPREIDSWLLSGVERAAFVDAARDLQARLTDPVIESAVRRLPPEWYAIGGEQLIRDLKKRRGLLVEAAEAFYEHLARYVDVQGTDQADRALLTREADGSVTLEMSLESGSAPPLPYFRRRFLPAETKEIRIYLYGGRDHFVATGPRGGITVRVSGGAQQDVLDDSLSGGTQFYDAEEGEVVDGRGTGVSRRPWTRVPSKPGAPWMEKQDYGSLTLLTPLVWWEPDPGIVLSMGATRYTYGFRKLPYSTMQHAAVEWKTKRGAFGASYTGDFRWTRPGYATFVELSADGAENYNFFGFGNESAFVDDDELKEVHQKEFIAFPSLVAYENRRRTFWYAVGPEVKFSQDRPEGDSLLGSTQPYGFGDFGQVGGRVEVHVDTRGRLLAGMGLAGLAPGTKRTDTGLKAEIQGRIYPKAWDVEETFGVAFGELTGYLQAAPRLTLAARVGGQKNWGRYPWFESAFIGGSDNVRGYDRNRFAGDSSAYANVQAMFTLFNLNLILPLRFGVLGLADVGRVWVEGEGSDKWHPAAGGGIFVRIITAEVAFHALIASGDEGTKFYVNIGFGI